MRIESSVTAISWIPSDAIEGMPKLPFELGVAKYDVPPPDSLHEGDLERLRAEDRFREANRLAAWIEVEDGKIVGHGYEGAGLVGSTTFNLGIRDITIPGVAFEVLRDDPEVEGDAVRFVQTVGGRAGFPAPRRVVGKPFVRIQSATAWTTLALTIRADGSAEHELVGASTFPRHWVYDHDGNLVAKSGTIDFKTWYREAHGEHTPWGDEESAAFVAAAESALERRVSRELMAGNPDPRAAPARAGRHARRAGRCRRRALPRPGRGTRGRRRRRGGRGDRPRRHRRRARAARGRDADGHPPRPHARSHRGDPGSLIDRQELEDLAATRRA